MAIEKVSPGSPIWPLLRSDFFIAHLVNGGWISESSSDVDCDEEEE